VTRRQIGDGSPHLSHANDRQASCHDALPPKNAACSRCIAGFT
jgi:hypothetical protein